MSVRLSTETLGKIALALRYVTEHDRDLARSRALAAQALDALRADLARQPSAPAEERAAQHERV